MENQTQSTLETKATLVWFRNDLRSHDNTSLTEACKDHVGVIGLYCFDPRHFAVSDFGFKKMERFRARFLIETVKELREHLEKINIPLFVYHGKPEEHIPKLVEAHNVHAIFLQREWTQEETDVRDAVKKALPEAIAFQECYDQFIFHPEDIPYPDFQEIPKVFTNFRKKCEKQASVRSCSPVPEQRPESNLLENGTGIPTLSQLGFAAFETDPRTAFPFSGGEQQAWNRLKHYFWKTEKLAMYKKTRNGLIGKDYSSKFSAWLANGSISARAIYWLVKKFEEKVTKNQDTYWLIFELIWRDYFKYVSLKYGNAIFYEGGILEKDYDWKYNDKALEEWKNGNTKYDFVNANMREIATTGWMSNRGRQNVASYWAKELKQDWRIGATYFESLLLDYDVHSNWGNWMYNAGVGNDPRDRKFNIESQADRYDSNGKFRRLWFQGQLDL